MGWPTGIQPMYTADSSTYYAGESIVRGIVYPQLNTYNIWLLNSYNNDTQHNIKRIFRVSQFSPIAEYHYPENPLVLK